MSPDQIVEALLDEAPRNPRQRMAELEKFIAHLDTTVRQSKDDEAVFPNGKPAALCWSGADYVKAKYGGERFGFGERSDIENTDTQGGHDFAVVDGRFIVDYWLKHVVGEERGVFDMQNPQDAQFIRHYYGDPKQWEKAETKPEPKKVAPTPAPQRGPKINLDDPQNWPLT